MLASSAKTLPTCVSLVATLPFVCGMRLGDWSPPPEATRFKKRTMHLTRDCKGGGMESGLLDERCGCGPLRVRTDPITDTYAVEARPFARGKFASVRRCRHLVSGAEFAAKSMRKRRRATDVRHEIMHEAHVLLLSSAHPRIVRMHEVYETPSEIVLVLELVQGGELQRVLDDEEAVGEAEAARLLRQILDGVAFLHRHNIAHLDLKPQNLLLTKPFLEGGEVKLCDFGISRLISKGVEIREIVGTPDYVAPEVLHYEPISLPTDMWSVGVLTYVLLCGHSPFGGDSKQETFCNITRGQLDFPPDLFPSTSPAALDFVACLLRRDPRERMTAVECLSHKWLAGAGHPSGDIHLTLSPGGATLLNRTGCMEEQDAHSCKNILQESDDKKILCSGDHFDVSQDTTFISTDVRSQESVHAKIPLHNVSPKVARTAFCQSQLLQAEMDVKLGNGADTENYVHKSPQPNDCKTANGSPNIGFSVLCHPTQRIGEPDSSHEKERLSCIGDSNDNHVPNKSPLLQHNGFVDKSGSPQIARTLLGQSFKKATPEKDVELDIALRDENEEPKLRTGVRLSPSPKVGRSTVFCQSQLHRTSESFTVKTEVGTTTVQQESKSRSSLVVTQFEGMSKHMAFSEEIIVDERVGMVY
ncbi:hypothetical protein JTE90_017191 [Oedothorax gibbosus]|uniref:Protein kinase domain-containing protein n=1 Tax=Oedothorax gibbosus TaxID=931172 RepID=A0AAV6V7P2_9ARAC|nr:hypothetical protein JTE90_017191 [Oedothorax gibbosus]